MSDPVDPALAAWLAGARSAATQPVAMPRLPLVAAGHLVGSVAIGFLDSIASHPMLDKHGVLSIGEHDGLPAWCLNVVPDALTPALNTLAAVLRERGLCGAWRDEQLAVCNAAGEPVGTIERGAVRVLGLATRAVHLVGTTADGRVWVQLRSQTKPNNPGQWDTLMGGMVSAADLLTTALARETWEEAGLRLEQLDGVAHGGQVVFSRPSREGGGAGYMVERIDWFQAQLPPGLAPSNQDGEVERFEALEPPTLRQWLAQGRFTLEAGLVLAQFLRL